MVERFYSQFIDAKNADPRLLAEGVKPYPEQGYSGKILSGNKALLHVDLFNAEKLRPLEQVDTADKMITAYHETAELAGLADFCMYAKNLFHRDVEAGTKILYDKTIRGVNSYNRFTVLVDFNKGKSLSTQAQIIDFKKDIELDPVYDSFRYFGIKNPADERDYTEKRNLVCWADKMTQSREIMDLYRQLLRRKGVASTTGNFVVFAAAEAVKRAIGNERKNGLALMSYDCTPNVEEPYCYSENPSANMTDFFTNMARSPAAYFNNIAWLLFQRTGKPHFSPDDVIEISEYLNVQKRLYQPTYDGVCYYTPKESAKIINMNEKAGKYDLDDRSLPGIYIHPAKRSRITLG